MKNTWAMDTSTIEYFSDKLDTSIPTRTIKGVHNTEKGVFCWWKLHSVLF